MKRKESYEDLGYAKVDHHRIKRKGFPEVIYCPGKTTKQIVEIAKRIYQKKHPVLMTRAEPKVYKTIKKAFKKAKYHKEARIIEIRKTIDDRRKTGKDKQKPIAIVSAGTADIPVAEEALVTAQFLGLKAEKLYDVGVAGIHRLLKNLDKLKEAKVIIVVAGMEGALPSVVGGLVEAPVIAVPTSVGYGANFKGIAPLLTMMNSCAPGVAVVNIDNGFGAAMMAYSILRKVGLSNFRERKKTQRSSARGLIMNK